MNDPYRFDSLQEIMVNYDGGSIDSNELHTSEAKS